MFILNQVTVFYPSGKKSSFVEDETQKGICKSLLRSNCTNKLLLDQLTESNPTETVTCASKVIATQCKNVCKKTSGSLLMKKTHNELMNFQFEALHEELKSKCPALVSVLTSAISDHPIPTDSKTFRQLVMTAAVALQGRFQDMSAIQYIIGFILTHGGCTQKDIQRLAHVGLSLHPKTLHQKLASWQIHLSDEIMKLKEDWAQGGQKKYQLVGDNWDKNVLPSYRTSDRKTLSLHLFNMYAIVDRVVPEPDACYSSPLEACQMDTQVFIPSESEQKKLLEEMKFLVSTSLVSNHPQLGKVLNKIYPKHLQHSYSQYAGEKTKQYPIGLFDCNENKTQELIKLLAQLTDDYVPFAEGDIVESVFLGGDRLTDERVQGAQQAMQNGSTPKDRLEGFISKTEDFHRLMNFLEAIHKLTYDTKSVQEKGSVHYYRNMLNMRNAKGPVRNAYRPYKMLYYIIWDALCLIMFLEEAGVEEITTEIPYPDNFEGFSSQDKIKWLDDMSEAILKRWFFENTDDIFREVRDILEDPDHPENYWCSTLNDGRVKCHHCEKTYARVATLQAHESKHHGVQIQKRKKKSKSKTDDQVQNYVLSLFKMLTLHKNLDTAVDMADGERSVRSAKYELPLYNRTNKVKYTIGSIHLTALTSGMLSKEQSERLIANRTVNIQGGKKQKHCTR